ncbi:MAG: glycosyltransferase [Acidobacteria bacterium]|nr:glycosyltransferase [Acidobacteriota bacterium]
MATDLAPPLVTRRERVVMVTSSYPRFRGDTVGTFLEPIAKGLAAYGHEIHVVLPWHPLLKRSPSEDDVHFHPFRYAPHRALHVFGYAGALAEDIRLRAPALAVTPVAVLSAWASARGLARRIDATIIHAHWVVPGGAIAAFAATRVPHVISLHGSDVYVAERYGFARTAARLALRRAAWVTACSDELRHRAVRLGAPPGRATTIAYGVDADQFRPDAARRLAYRSRLGVGETTKIVFAAGRFVRKKGFEYLIDAFGLPELSAKHALLVIAGSGDLEPELQARAARLGSSRVRFVGLVPHDDLAGYLAAADVIVVPSVHDEAGNVDGLPNVVMEALASATPLVTTTAGGIGSVVEADRTGLLVPERSPAGLAAAISRLLDDPGLASRIGHQAREEALARHGWGAVVQRFDEVYRQARQGCL